MGLGLTLPYCFPSLGQHVPVNVFQREFACRRIHAIEHYVDVCCPFLTEPPIMHTLAGMPFSYSCAHREVLG